MPGKGYRGSGVAVASPEGCWHPRRLSIHFHFPRGRNGVRDQVVVFSI